MDENKSSLYIVAIVAIIAVVALVIMITGVGSRNVVFSESTEGVLTSADTITDASGDVKARPCYSCHCDCPTREYDVDGKGNCYFNCIEHCWTVSCSGP